MLFKIVHPSQQLFSCWLQTVGCGYCCLYWSENKYVTTLAFFYSFHWEFHFLYVLMLSIDIFLKDNYFWYSWNHPRHSNTLSTILYTVCKYNMLVLIHTNSSCLRVSQDYRIFRSIWRRSCNHAKHVANNWLIIVNVTSSDWGHYNCFYYKLIQFWESHKWDFF